MSSPNTISSTIDKFYMSKIDNKDPLGVQINNAIRKGEVKKFIKTGRTASIEISTEEVVDKGLQDHLLHLKNSCSQLTRELQKKEAQAIRYKDEVGFTQEKAKKIKLNRQVLEDKIAELEKNLNQINIKNESAVHCKKTYEHILQRMKKDGIYKQMKKNELERDLKNLKREHGITESKKYSVTEFEKLTLVGLKDASEEVELQSDLRKSKIKSFNKEVGRRMEFQNKLFQRQRETDQIQELAACDIQDADLLRLKKFLTVQVFLRNLLKTKMNKLKQRFLPCERAFYQIKSNTRVQEIGALKAEFFNFQDLYNEKTAIVAKVQEDVTEATKQNETLKKKMNETMISEMEIMEMMESSTKKEDDTNKRALLEKSFMYECLWERLASWMRVQAHKLKIYANADEEQALFHSIIDKINVKNEFKDDASEEDTTSIENSQVLQVEAQAEQTS